jgi:anti-anti-sigma factor
MAPVTAARAKASAWVVPTLHVRHPEGLGIDVFRLGVSAVMGLRTPVSMVAHAGKVNMPTMTGRLLKCQIDEAMFANIIRPSGEIDLSTVSILGRALATAFSRGRHVIIDLSEVTYIDSTGFREILAHCRIYHENDRRMVLANAKEPVQHVIDRLNLYQAIPVFSSVETAANSLERRRAL